MARLIHSSIGHNKLSISRERPRVASRPIKIKSNKGFLSQFLIPVFVSVVLHGILLVVLFFGWESAPPKQVNSTPKFVKATLVELKPKTKKVVSTKSKPKKVDLTAKRREQKRREQEKKRLAEQKRKAELKRKEAQKKKEKEEAEKKAREAEKARLEKEKEKERQRLQAQQELERAMREEEQALLEEEFETEAQSYVSVISDRVERQWSRPPSARKGMQCELLIQLVPTGQVVSATVVKSSGNAAFDRSAEQAVKKVDRFPEIKDMPPEIFERYYRQFRLKFNPQDLRQ